MVFFALTRSGYEDIEGLLVQPSAVLWVNEGVLTESEYEAIWRAGVSISKFSSRVALERAEIEDALATIQEHHPNTSIWVESIGGSNEGVA